MLGLNVISDFRRESLPSLRESLASAWGRCAAAAPLRVLQGRGLFLAASLITTLGLTGGHTDEIQLLGRWVMLVALAAVGLQGHWRAFAGAGARPLLLGGITWFAVAASSLLVQAFTRQL